MAKRTMIAHRTGISSTGTPHSLLVEDENGQGIRFTVVGSDGSKRHAAVVLTDDLTASLVESLGAHLKSRA
jgi:hypothetical protein